MQSRSLDQPLWLRLVAFASRRPILGRVKKMSTGVAGLGENLRDKPPLSQWTASVLRVFLADVDAEFTGLDLVERTGLLPGTTYPILVRLQQAGWVTARWSNPAGGGPVTRKRYYRGVPSGLLEAQRALAEHDAVQAKGLVCHRWTSCS
jgi:PadR family transcriptional regulator PadR